jgi:hypothetical protein
MAVYSNFKKHGIIKMGFGAEPTKLLKSGIAM